MKKRRINAKPKKPIDALATLGSFLDEDELENRDAVHIAVLPVTANRDMKPGDHVGISGDLYADTRAEKKIGIVDPYLPRPVKRHDRFYLFLYPRTITSLAHHWVHPDVPNVETLVEEKTTSNMVANSERWLRDWCNDRSYDTPSYSTLISSAVNSLEYPDEYMTIMGEDANGSIPAEVIAHLKIVLGAYGHTIPASWGPQYFSCSC